MNHYVYETTNLVNGKKYIGKRSCRCPIEEDKYMGSGKLIRKALKKYGDSNFKKQILELCENEEMAFNREIYYIDKFKAYNNPNYYNIASGGNGGYQVFAGKTKEEIDTRNKKISNKNKEFLEKNPNSFYGKHHTTDTKKILRDKRVGKFIGKDNFFYNKKHTPEAKLKMSKAREKYKNENHTQARKIICLTTMEFFPCIKFASEKYSINHRNISSNCRGKLRSAGKHPETNKKMVWAYYEDYLQSTYNK